MDLLLAIPIVFFFLFAVISYVGSGKKFVFNHNLTMLGILTLAYVIAHFFTEASWKFALIQMGAAILFFVLIIGALGTKASGATILSITALGALSPSPFFIWVFGAGMLAIILGSILRTRGALSQVKFLVQEVSVNGRIDYSNLPEQQESLKESSQTHFVPLYGLIGVLVGIMSHMAFTALV